MCVQRTQQYRREIQSLAKSVSSPFAQKKFVSTDCLGSKCIIGTPCKRNQENRIETLVPHLDYNMYLIEMHKILMQLLTGS
jgi:hypothetical protein